MRLNLLLLAILPSAALFFCGAEAHAGGPASNEDRADEASFGTIPARSKAQMTQPSVPAPAPMPAQQHLDAPTGFAVPPESRSPSLGVETAEEYDRDRPRRNYAPIATEPPGDWAVLHAGLRPRIGTFGGIATLALAHARTEAFYGGFSLSAVRNDAGTHIGLAQVALGRNLSDSFGGGFQLSISENRARNFIGLGQTALAYNRALSITAITQIAAFNRAKTFTGAAQIGPYNRTDAEFNGVAQVGAYNHSRGDFSGLVQLGAVSASGRQLFGDRDYAADKSRFAGLAQVGVVSSAHGSFYGLAQVGVASFTSTDFRGLAQIGALGASAGDFKGVAQLGLVSMSRTSTGLQIGGGAIAQEEHTGIQIGALGTWAKSVDGAQVGVANLAERVRGVQIGLFNHAKSLRGMQIGLANHAEDGVLPWTALLNFGFGDGGPDRADDGDYADQQRASSRATSTRGHL